VPNDQIGLRIDRVLRKPLHALDIACAEAVVDTDVSAFDPS
jgi:hypothetical protein